MVFAGTIKFRCKIGIPSVLSSSTGTHDIPPKINISSVACCAEKISVFHQQPGRVGELNIGSERATAAADGKSIIYSPCKYPDHPMADVHRNSVLVVGVGRESLVTKHFPRPIFTTLFLKGLLLLVHFFHCPTLRQPFQPQLLQQLYGLFNAPR